MCPGSQEHKDSILSLFLSIMDELIRLVVDNHGLDEGVTRKAIGTVLAFLKDHVGEDFDFSKITSQLDGAETLMNDAEAQTAAREGVETKSSGLSGIIGLIVSLMKTFGVLEVLKKILSTFFGDSAVKMIESVSDGAELAAILNKFGISQEQGIKIVKIMVNFTKDKIDPETVEQLAEHVPAVKAFLGGEGSKKED